MDGWMEEGAWDEQRASPAGVEYLLTYLLTYFTALAGWQSIDRPFKSS